MTKLSDTQRVILSAAAQHEMGLARAPKTLPAAARNAVFRSLIKNNLLTEINAPRDYVGWAGARMTRVPGSWRASPTRVSAARRPPAQFDLRAAPRLVERRVRPSAGSTKQRPDQ